MTDWPLVKIISGMQSGADLAGVKAGKLLGYEVGGKMPHKFLTENGYHPEYAEMFGAVAIDHGSYDERTKANVIESDGTWLFGDASSTGSRLTSHFCRLYHKPKLVIGNDPDGTDWYDVTYARSWIVRNHIRTLNVAGNREGRHEGIGAQVLAFLMESLKQP